MALFVNANSTFDEAADRTNEIQAAMRGAQWKTIKGSLSVLAAVSGIRRSLVLLLLYGMHFWRAPGASQDFTYAAYARAKL
jgi:hypothetical protein